MSTPATAPARRSSIRRTLFVFSLVLVLLPQMAVGIVGAMLGWQAQLQSTRDHLSAAADLKQAEIDRWIEERESDVSVLAADTALQQFLHTMLQSPEDSAGHLAAYSEVAVRLRSFLRKKVAFLEFSLIDAESGVAVISTDRRAEGESHLETTYFTHGKEASYLQPPIFDPAIGAPTILIARPVTAPTGEVQAVLVGRANLAHLNDLIGAQVGLGGTDETYLVSKERFYLAGSQDAGIGETVNTVTSSGIRKALSHQDGVGQYTNYRGEKVVGAYRWLPNLHVALLVEESTFVVTASARQQAFSILGIALAAAALATAMVALLTRRIVRPIIYLTEAATEIAAGDLERTVPVQRADEIGLLARAFNSMTGQLRDLIDSLEQRVEARTRELEQRSAYLEASATVGRTTASTLDTEQLIHQAVGLIRQQFNLDYVGLFLVDATGEWAVLEAGTGEANGAMQAPGYRIRIGAGMVGQSIASGQAYIAPRVAEADMHILTDEVPDTGSEVSLPLHSRGQIVGALTLQSSQPAAFDETAVAVLQVMADQVAVSLDNARLFAESRSSLEAARRATGEMSQEAWSELLRARPDLSYRSVEHGVTGAGDIWRPEMERAWQAGETVLDSSDGVETRLTLAVPIKVRGDVIGVLDTYKPAEAGEWTLEEVTLLETLADQLGMALESGRLYQEAERHAARERLTREITDKMRRATSIEDIVQTTVDELFGVLGASRTFVRLGVAPPEILRSAQPPEILRSAQNDEGSSPGSEILRSAQPPEILRSAQNDGDADQE